jgi:hypothetical protein
VGADGPKAGESIVEEALPFAPTTGLGVDVTPSGTAATQRATPPAPESSGEKPSQGGEVKKARRPPAAGQPIRQRRNVRRPAAATAINDGAELERRVARVEFAEGALARLRVPVRADADRGRDVLTDVDVLAIDVDLRLRVSIGVSECKSGEGQRGEPDRLFWLAGFQRYLGADRATLVRQTATRRGQAMARRLGLRILDTATLQHREAAQAWLPERFGHVGGTGCAAEEKRTETQLKGLREIAPDLVAFLRWEALTAMPHSVLGALLALSSSVQRQGVLPQPTGQILASHALVAFFAAALRDAGQLDVIPADDLSTGLGLALTVGGEDNAHVLDILDTVDAVVRDIVEQVHDAYSGRGAARIDVPTPSLKSAVAEPPTGVIDRYLDVVERLRANPAVARDMLQTTELACFDALCGDSAWTAPAFDHLFTPEHRQLLLAGVRALSEICGEFIADRLSDLDRLPVDRVASPLPDRRGTAAGNPVSAAPRLAQPASPSGQRNN